MELLVSNELEDNSELKEVEVAYDPILHLPQETVFYWVFPCLELSDLCTLREVSKTWKKWIEAFFHQMKLIDITPVEHILTADGLYHILLHMSNIVEINLDNCWISATEENLLLLGDRCPKLRIFSAAHCKEVTDDVLANFAKKCQKLRFLEISYCFSITDSGVSSIAEGCPQLTVLKVGNNYGVSDKSVIKLAKCSQHLQDLDLCRCFQVTDDGLRYLLPPPSSKPSLAYLRITGCTRVSQQLMLKFADIGIVVNNCF